MSLVCLRWGIQGIPNKILSTGCISVFHTPTIIISLPSSTLCTLLLHGTLPCHEKTYDHQLECFDWRCGNSCGRETFTIPLEEYYRCWSCGWFNLGDNINFGWIYYFTLNGNRANWRGSIITWKESINSDVNIVDEAAFVIKCGLFYTFVCRPFSYQPALLDMNI